MPERFYVLTVDPDTKLPFAEWVVERAREDVTLLEPFRAVVEGIHEILVGPLHPPDGGG